MAFLVNLYNHESGFRHDIESSSKKKLLIEISTEKIKPKIQELYEFEHRDESINSNEAVFG